MIRALADRLRFTPIYDLYVPLVRATRLLLWRLKRRPLPPPDALKMRTIKLYAARFSLENLVETGTYRGGTLYSCRRVFKRLYSVELSKDLYEQARRLLARFPQIALLHGDSSSTLPSILRDIDRPSLFWLDAHYSGGATARGELETPVLQELHHILAHPVPGHVVLVDDARLFVGKEGYPRIEELERYVLAKRPDWTFEVRDDIIRTHMRRRGLRP